MIVAIFKLAALPFTWHCRRRSRGGSSTGYGADSVDPTVQSDGARPAVVDSGMLLSNPREMPP